MTKEKFEKILLGDAFSVEDLTPDEKKVVYEAMQKYGMPQSTAYVRFFDKGFDPWEISGVNKTQKEFLLTTFADIDGTGNDEEGSRGYGYVLTLAKNYDDKKFYDICTQLNVGQKLCEFMAVRGMKSPVTVRKRFREADWQPWETVGIEAIIDEICKPKGKTRQRKPEL